MRATVDSIVLINDPHISTYFPSFFYSFSFFFWKFRRQFSRYDDRNACFFFFLFFLFEDPSHWTRHRFQASRKASRFLKEELDVTSSYGRGHFSRRKTRNKNITSPLFVVRTEVECCTWRSEKFWVLNCKTNTSCLRERHTYSTYK